MQSLQKRFTGEGVQWIVITSTSPAHSTTSSPLSRRPGSPGHGAAASVAALDADGRIGRAYAAKVTPHMYVIDPGGALVYAGAIDDKRSANPADVKTASNYVVQAFAELRAGKPVLGGRHPGLRLPRSSYD